MCSLFSSQIVPKGVKNFTDLTVIDNCNMFKTFFTFYCGRLNSLIGNLNSQ